MANGRTPEMSITTRRIGGVVMINASDVINMLRMQSLLRRGTVFPDGDPDLDYMADQLEDIVRYHDNGNV